MKKYRKNSLKHALDEPDVPEGPIGDLMSEDVMNLNSSRRNFLKVFGFSFASAAVLAACKRPVREAIPYAVQPPELIPRIPLYFASTYFDGHDYCSVLVKSFDGRPVKIEGNALSLFNGEATTARIQASVLSLYDDARLKYPMSGNSRASWETVDGEIIKQLREISSSGRQIALLTPTIISPTTIRLIRQFGQGYNNFRWVQYDPISYSAVRDANEASFGKRVFPDYNFQNTDMVVSVNCDFLGTWGAPVHFIGRYVSRRRLTDGNKSMLYHLQYESGLTLTGSNSDRRVKIMPSEEKTLLSDLYNKIASKTGGTTMQSPDFREDLSEVADRLLAAKGRSIVVSGTNDTGIQVIVNAINSLLGNYTTCIDLDNSLNIAAGNDRETETLINDLNEGRIGALLMYNVNPAYDFPDPVRFTEALGKTALTVNMSVALNETTGKAKYECPVNHYLESWDDAEITPGQLSLAQPCINKIFDTRSFQDSLLKWSGDNNSWQNYLVSSWEREYFPLSGAGAFREFWNKSLSDGVFSYKPQNGKAAAFSSDAINRAMSSRPAVTGSGYEIILTESVSMGTGMNANNPWLIELPDPVTRHCWENVALVSPADAANLGISDGQVINIGPAIAIPALIQPGQAEHTISIHLGYGHESVGKVASGIGVNLYPFAGYVNGNRSYGFNVPEVTVTPEIRPLALVQIHNSQEGRP
ncbi:MAG: molybdopterin oxidoreductase, partial [Chloroflexota bacterium]